MSKKYNDEYDDADTIELDLDDGTKLICEIIGCFDVGAQTYIALLPVEYPITYDYDEDEVLVYRYIEISDEEFNLETIEDDDEFEMVADAFDEMLDEMEFNSMPEDD